MPLILLVLILVAVGAQPFLPIVVQEGLYALSLSIKNCILFLLPIVVFCMLFTTALRLAKGASKMIGFLVVAIVVSNFISTLFGGCIGHVMYGFSGQMPVPETLHELSPLWQFSLPRWIGTGSAMILGLGAGLLLRKFQSRLVNIADRISNGLLKIFLALIPFFIFGFIIKMVHDGVLIHIVRQYGWIVGIIALSAFSYILFLYFLVNRFVWKDVKRNLENMFPALAVAFGTMSSAAALPMTLLAAEKNNKNPELAKSVTAATVNVHLIGDCFGIAIFAFAVLKSFGFPEPTLMAYLTFTLYFVLAKFSVAAVPGGGILVMLSILESYLGFDGAMLSLITALYILFDPITTSANVLGNGAFTRVIDRWTEKRQAENYT